MATLTQNTNGVITLVTGVVETILPSGVAFQKKGSSLLLVDQELKLRSEIREVDITSITASDGSTISNPTLTQAFGFIRDNFFFRVTNSTNGDSLVIPSDFVFVDSLERDSFFTQAVNRSRLEQGATYISVGALFERWDGDTAPPTYSSSNWTDVTAIIQGPRGEQGMQGPQGDKGDKGDTGDTGPQGPPGSGGGSGEDNVQSNWDETDIADDSYIQNKPTTITTAQSDKLETIEAYADMQFVVEEPFTTKQLTSVSSFTAPNQFINPGFDYDSIQVSIATSEVSSFLSSFLIGFYFGENDPNAGQFIQFCEITSITSQSQGGAYHTVTINGGFYTQTQTDTSARLGNIIGTVSLELRSHRRRNFVHSPQADYAESDALQRSFIRNKPTTITPGQSAEIAANTAAIAEVHFLPHSNYAVERTDEYKLFTIVSTLTAINQIEIPSDNVTIRIRVDLFGNPQFSLREGEAFSIHQAESRSNPNAGLVFGVVNTRTTELVGNDVIETLDCDLYHYDGDQPDDLEPIAIGTAGQEVRIRTYTLFRFHEIPHPDWNEADTEHPDYIENKPTTITAVQSTKLAAIEERARETVVADDTPFFSHEFEIVSSITGNNQILQASGTITELEFRLSQTNFASGATVGDILLLEEGSGQSLEGTHLIQGVITNVSGTPISDDISVTITARFTNTSNGTDSLSIGSLGINVRILFYRRSFIRFSGLPDWGETNEHSPDYIANKELVNTPLALKPNAFFVNHLSRAASSTFITGNSIDGNALVVDDTILVPDNGSGAASSVVSIYRVTGTTPPVIESTFSAASLRIGDRVFVLNGESFKSTTWYLTETGTNKLFVQAHNKSAFARTVESPTGATVTVTNSESDYTLEDEGTALVNIGTFNDLFGLVANEEFNIFNFTSNMVEVAVTDGTFTIFQGTNTGRFWLLAGETRRFLKLAGTQRFTPIGEIVYSMFLKNAVTASPSGAEHLLANFTLPDSLENSGDELQTLTETGSLLQIHQTGTLKISGTLTMIWLGATVASAQLHQLIVRRVTDPDSANTEVDVLTQGLYYTSDQDHPSQIPFVLDGFTVTKDDYYRFYLASLVGGSETILEVKMDGRLITKQA